MPGMRRRDVVALLGGAAAAWPMAARAQQTERVRRVGLLIPGTRTMRKIRLDRRVFAGAATIGLDDRRRSADRCPLWRHRHRRHSQACSGIGRFRAGCRSGSRQWPGGGVEAGDRTLPIVFPWSATPSAAGIVDSLARPGGNATGFAQFEFSMREMVGAAQARLRQHGPGGNPSGSRPGDWDQPVCCRPGRGAIARVEVTPISMRDVGELEQSIETFARAPNGGLILTASGAAQRHRDLIIALAARYKLPAVYYARFFVAAGGLISYGIDLLISTGVRPATSTASSKARSRPICRCRRRPNTNW